MTGEEKNTDASTTQQAKPNPVQREQEELKLDPERREEVLNQSISSLESDENLTPTLEKAIGMTADWDRRKKASEDNIKKRYFKNDEAGFEQWNTRLEKVARENQLRESIRRYEESQTRQFIKVQNGVNMERRERSQQSLTQTQNNVAISEIAERRHTAQTEYESAIAKANKAYEAFKALDAKNRAGAGDDKDKIAACDETFGAETTKYVEQIKTIQKRKDDALALAKHQYDETMTQNRQALRDWYKKQVQLETQFQMKCGYGEEMAFNIAVSSVGKHSEQMLKNLIDAGQGDFVQTFLQELSKSDADLKAIPRMEHDGKPVVNAEGKQMVDYEYDPNGRLCMSISQVVGVQDYLDKKIESDIRLRKLASQQAERQFDVEASRLRVTADELSMKPELDLDAMKQLMDGAKKLQDAGYDKAYQVSSHLASIVKSAERKSSRLQKEAAKLETEEDFQRELDAYAQYEDTAAALAVFAPGSDGAKLAVSRMVDGQNRMIILINNGISRGILKTQRWKSELARLQSGRAGEDKRATLNVLADIGISVDQDMTRELQEELRKTGGAMQDIAPGVTFKGFDDESDERQVKIRHANTLIYTWNDPATGRKYAMSGDEYNDLTSVIAKWQKRHVNPSPTGEDPTELKEFVLSVLRNSRTQTTIKRIWPFSDVEGFGMGDISRIGRNEIEKYFHPTTVDAEGRKVYNTKARLDRDIEAIEAASRIRALPSLGALRRIVETQTGVE